MFIPQVLLSLFIAVDNFSSSHSVTIPVVIASAVIAVLVLVVMIVTYRIHKRLKRKRTVQ